MTEEYKERQRTRGKKTKQNTENTALTRFRRWLLLFTGGSTERTEVGEGRKVLSILCLETATLFILYWTYLHTLPLSNSLDYVSRNYIRYTIGQPILQTTGLDTKVSGLTALPRLQESRGRKQHTKRSNTIPNFSYDSSLSSGNRHPAYTFVYASTSTIIY